MYYALILRRLLYKYLFVLIYIQHLLLLIFLDFDVSSKYVLDKCNEPCLKLLLCGDMCSGTCGKCKQGRLHVPCEEMCNKINPCNHTCVYNIQYII